MARGPQAWCSAPPDRARPVSAGCSRSWRWPRLRIGQHQLRAVIAGRQRAGSGASSFVLVPAYTMSMATAPPVTCEPPTLTNRNLPAGRRWVLPGLITSKTRSDEPRTELWETSPMASAGSRAPGTSIATAIALPRTSGPRPPHRRSSLPPPEARGLRSDEALDRSRPVPSQRRQSQSWRLVGRGGGARGGGARGGDPSRGHHGRCDQDAPTPRTSAVRQPAGR